MALPFHPWLSLLLLCLFLGLLSAAEQNVNDPFSLSLSNSAPQSTLVDFHRHVLERILTEQHHHLPLPMTKRYLDQLADQSPNPDAAHGFVESLFSVDKNLEGHLDEFSLHDLIGNTPVQDDLDTTDMHAQHPNFPPPLASTSLVDLQLFASYSAAAYCMSWNIFPRWNCGYPRCSNPNLSLNQSLPVDLLSKTEPILYFKAPRTGMVGYVAVNPALNEQDHVTAVLAFRGTMNIQNTLYDLRVAQARYRYPGAPLAARVHSGFWLIWQETRKHVEEGLQQAMERLLSYEEEDKPLHVHVVVTGHSLGGAIAVLAGLDLLRMVTESHSFPGIPFDFIRSELVQEPLASHRLLQHHFGEQGPDGSHRTRLILSFRIYTYGEPRVGNEYFAKWVMSFEGLPVFRTTYYNDPIPHLPPRRLIPFDPFQFQHRKLKPYLQVNVIHI